MSSYLEHANVTVRNLDAIVSFIKMAIPDFKIRGQGETVYEKGSQKWLHVGTDSTYIALVEAVPDSAESPQEIPEPGLNHLGVVIDDADAAQKRLREAGYEEGPIVDPHPYRKRIYFNDPEGNEWEFVEYMTEDPAKRNEYS